MTFELRLKPVDKPEAGALWVELDDRGQCRITETTHALQVPWGESWHVTFVSPFNELPYWFKVLGSTSQSINVFADAFWQRPANGWLLESTSRPAFMNVNYKGWMIKQ